MTPVNINFNSLQNEDISWDKRVLENDEILMSQLHTIGGLCSYLETHLANRIVEESKAEEKYNMSYRNSEVKYLERCKNNKDKPPKARKDMKYEILALYPDTKLLWDEFCEARNRRIGSNAYKEQYATAYATLSRIVAIKESKRKQNG